MERHLRGRRWEVDLAFWLGVLPRAAVILFLGLLLAATGRWLFHSLGMAPPAAAPAAVAAPARPAGLFTATVTSRSARGVGSHFGGRVLEVPVQQGQRVTRGQLLFRMDTAELEKKLSDSVLRHRQASARADAARRARAEELADLERRITRLHREGREWERLAGRPQTEERLSLAGSYNNPILPADAKDLLRRVRASLARMRKEKKRAYHRHHLVIAAAVRQQRQAQQRAAHLRKLIAGSRPFSPISGVVTAVRTVPGAWTSARVPLVRVDDPEGYRLVLLAREAEARAWGPGAPLRLAGRNGDAVLEKKVKGWGRELFFTWIILRPPAPEKLAPGQRVEVRPPARQKNAGVAQVVTTPA